MNIATDHGLDDVERKYAQMRAGVQGRFPDADPLALELSFYLFHTGNRIQSHLADAAQKFGLTPASFNVLGLLHHGESAGTPLNELSHFLVVSRANVTGLIDSLEQKGLVERMHHASDRRVRLARITKKGESLLASFRPHYFKNIRALSDVLSVGEKKTLIHLLTKWNKELTSAH